MTIKKPLGLISFIEIKLHIAERNVDGTLSYIAGSPIDISLEEFSMMADTTIDSVKGIARTELRKLLDQTVTEKLELTGDISKDR